MGVLRTPDERFGGLPGYPFEPNYVQVKSDGLASVRMHYAEAGPKDGPVVVLVHGQPTWSYLYRTVIGVLADAGLRAVAPDNIGYGRSDKLTEPTDYTVRRHIDWLHGLVIGLDLRDVTLVVQDWGGPIGLSVLARDPDRFARVVATNTARVLACELLCAAQGLEFLKPLRPGRGAEAAYLHIRERVRPLRRDRPLYRDLRAVEGMIRSRSLLVAVEAVSGPLL